MFRNNPLQTHFAGLLEEPRADCAGLMLVVQDAVTGSLEQLA
jgi:hypothetical protein